MSDDAILVEFTNWRPNMRHKTLVLLFEVPIEQQSEVLRILGPPSPDKPVYCGIAPIHSIEIDGKAQPLKAQHPIILEAVLLCKEPRFQRWLCRHDAYDRVGSEERAISKIYQICGIVSRRELAENEAARQAFRTLVGDYQAYYRGVSR